MTEIGMLRACREDQPVVRGGPAAVEPDQFGRCVDARDLAQQRRDFLAFVHQLPDGPGDLGGTERRRRHLVKERLEQMVVPAVNQRDVRVDALQFLDGGEPTKSPTDDDDLWSVGHSVHQSRAPQEVCLRSLRYNSASDRVRKPSHAAGARLTRDGFTSRSEGRIERAWMPKPCTRRAASQWRR
jgi:hypothetical protein